MKKKIITKKYKRKPTITSKFDSLKSLAKCFAIALIIFGGMVGELKIVFAQNSVKSEEIQNGFVPEKIEVIQNQQEPLVVIPKNLSGTLEERKNYILSYLKLKGETDLARWGKIINAESGFDANSKAPTYWSLCDRAVTVTLWGYQQPANSFIELRDYPNGIWQATCEEFGAITLRTGVSQGLTHIIETTWETYNCSGDITNWTDQLDCSLKIRNNQGWQAWSTN